MFALVSTQGSTEVPPSQQLHLIPNVEGMTMPKAHPSWRGTSLIVHRLLLKPCPACALSRGGASSCRSRTLHPWRGLRDVRHFVRLLRYLAPAPEGIELSQSSVTPTRMLGGHDAQL